MALTPPLGKFDILDPTFELKRVCTNLSITFDKWADLDPTLAAKRINAVHSGTIGAEELLDPASWIEAVQPITV